MTSDDTFKVLSRRYEYGPNHIVIEGRGLTWDEAVRLMEKLKQLDINAWHEREQHKD